MKKKEWNEGLDHLDPDLVEKYVEQKDRLRQKNKKSKTVWLRFGAIAACFMLILSAVIVVPMLQDNNLPDVPTWDTAQYSAEEIGNLFGLNTYDGVATNAYTTIYVPNSKYLYIGDVPNEEYIDLYQYERTNKKLSKAELQTFTDAFLPKLAESLNATVPQYSIKENDYGYNVLSADIDIGPYRMWTSQNDKRNSFGLSKLKGNRQIVIGGEAIQIDQRLSDEEILESIQSIKNKLFGIFNVSFSDAKVVRRFGSDTEHGAERINIYFYDESAHYLNSIQDTPITDYVYISFDNFDNYSSDLVSDSVLKVSAVYYFKNRNNVSNTPQYEVVAHAKRISVSEAEALLYNGYVFGGHSCPLCMEAQDKVDFEGYDFVDIEYVVFGYGNKKRELMPFYAFYKNIGTSKNGNTIYAKTYVAAIEVSGYKEYFESQKDNHRKNWYAEEIG